MPPPERRLTWRGVGSIDVPITQAWLKRAIKMTIGIGTPSTKSKMERI
jgi:hypothetical protein